MISRSKWIGVGAIAFFTVSAFADVTPKVQPGYKAPRTEYGQPDLQGNWTNATLTPVERDPKYGDQLVIGDKDAKALEQENQDFRDEQNKPTDPSHGIEDLPKDCGGGFSGVNCGYNNFWVDPGSHLMSINGEKRTSIIVEPKNGRFPALTAQGQARLMQMYAAFRGPNGADGPEVRPLGERCILSFDSSAGPPMLPLLYNNNYQIVQTDDVVMIHVEMVHDVRMVRLNAQHGPSSVRKWLGDSIGRWEGDTLVIETTNFKKEQSFRGSSENMKVVERLTRVSPNQIVYSFTIEDPANYTAPFSGQLAFNATNEKIYEYACHEGNYALPGILAGAREQEKTAAKK
ncbi:hypothetical protein HNQ60_002597 [Povalibacter uvarum]|uniref:Uncharacterized protein n=1 Tax=Povalibacter uvarum TaxID=732238 RepID=A0A841HLG7_9GAMM|nr:hypothetical protein [Povalibacter uvarum]MBB6093716.1 hypothetical protein [Povalibacter uvarum]